MTPAEAAELLTIASGYDSRTYEALQAAAWSTALHGLDLEDCRQAVHQHYRNSTDWLMPATIRLLVRNMVRDRQEAFRDSYQTALDATADPQTVADRVTAIRDALAAANRMPGEESPHPPQLSDGARAARRIACPWCGASIGQPCIVSATGKTLTIIHDVRLDAVAKVPA